MSPATMTAADLVRQLRECGYELTPREPNRIHCKYVGAGTPPRAAGPLLGELKARKAEALELLGDPERPETWNEADAPEWDDDRERKRLTVAYDRADTEAMRADSWSDAWAWCTRRRPDLVEAVDDALDAIDAAFRGEDVGRNVEACRLLEGAVRSAATAYQERAK